MYSDTCQCRRFWSACWRSACREVEGISVFRPGLPGLQVHVSENELLGKSFEPTTIGLSCAIVPLAAAAMADARMRRECAPETGADSSCHVGPFLVKVSMSGPVRAIMPQAVDRVLVSRSARLGHQHEARSGARPAGRLYLHGYPREDVLTERLDPMMTPSVHWRRPQPTRIASPPR